MYARKYGHLPVEDIASEIQIPEKYDGNAFETVDIPQETSPQAETQTQTAPPFQGLTKSFSSDTLLLLLAFLLMGSEEGDELSGILIFLMLL